MQLPINLTASLQTTRWKAILDPILENPINNISLLENITINAGLNSINHKLNKIPQGWTILDIASPANIYRYADSTDSVLKLACIFSVILFSGDTTVGSSVITNIPSAQIGFLQVNQIVNSYFGTGVATNSKILFVGTNSVTLDQPAIGTTTANSFNAQQTKTTMTLGVY